ncbi:MAG: DNA repair protein RadA [Patescibacteria group bacterium]|nr:DNA repair protein RadA [Patescibacteria group bacterium]MDD3434991.1 DNA repair protein RadA [Patescibacteria group bacterium]MDD4466685.1 DNA repair protein RadA [Patescibacteria group bacterium]
MAALKTIYVCSNCDAQFPKWSGRCLECGSWGTLSEQIKDQKESTKLNLNKLGGADLLDLREIKSDKMSRFLTGLTEVDGVLGGGLVSGSLILLAGEPGIGKSTLVAQIADSLGKGLSSLEKGAVVIYASGEESAQQVKDRFERLGGALDNLRFISETNIEKIIATATKARPRLLIIDSIQTVYSALVPSEAGSLNQIRAAAVKLLELAKGAGVTVIMIGHITKDGQVAGPKSLEHIVDTVIYLEAEKSNSFCLLRASKNRFGATSELGVLEMTSQGFRGVANPSSVFIEGLNDNISGSVAGCVLEGARPFLVDLQSLVSKTVFGYPQRKASGFDLNRLQVLAAVISKRTKVNLSSQDIILNLVGGLRLADPALDLTACAAMIASFYNYNFSRQTIIIGEVGLGGEIRSVVRLEQRLKEAEKLGFKEALIPDVALKSSKLKLIKLKNLNDLVQFIK